MTTPEEYKYVEHPMQEITSKIARLFEQDIEVIYSHLDTRSCVIAGPFGIGKSTYLLPGIIKMAQMNGYDVFCKDAQSVNDRDDLDNSPPASERGLVIIDEASELSDLPDGEKEIRRIITTAYEKGYKVVPTLAYHIEAEDEKERHIQMWTNTLTEVTGTAPFIADLRAKPLPPHLAKEFIEALNSQKLTPMSAEVLDYVLSTVPRNLLILDTLCRHNFQSTRDAALGILDYEGRWLGMIDSNEWTRMREKCFKDIGLA